jgi:hypothetical protein
MKPDRILNIVLGIVVVILGFLFLSKSNRSPEPPPVAKPVELWRTNTVELWRTNTVDRWRTNLVEKWRTNTVVETVTKEVVKEVPAPLSSAEKQAAVAGYRGLNAPQLATPSDALYKVGSLAVDLQMNESTRSLLTEEEVDAIRAQVEGALRSQGLSIASGSPHRLKVQVTTLWTIDVPRVALLSFRLELEEQVLALRNTDLVQSSGVVWSSSRLGTLGRDSLADELKKLLQGQVRQFNDDVRKAKQKEKEIEARLPKIPADFVSQPE